jgi:hypothetical protein
MAITTIDGAISGLQFPRWFNKTTPSGGIASKPISFWGLGGFPPAGSFDTTLNGVTLTSPVTGQLPFTDPASGNAYLARLQAVSNFPGTLILADRLWHNGGYTITSTSAQNSTTPTWPARDVAGSTNGDGVLLACEISADTGAGTPTITVGYTNQSGTASRSATNIVATESAGTTTNFFYPIGLQAGDTGVQSLQSVTLSASWVSGTMNMVAYRELARMEITQIGKQFSADALTLGMPKMYAGSVPFLIYVPQQSSPTLNGSVQFTHG